MHTMAYEEKTWRHVISHTYICKKSKKQDADNNEPLCTQTGNEQVGVIQH